MTYPAKAPRSVRRAYSRDEARARAVYGIPGFPDGRGPAEIVWKKHVPVDPKRSGQARINAKRNSRAKFWADFDYHRDLAEAAVAILHEVTA